METKLRKSLYLLFVNIYWIFGDNAMYNYQIIPLDNQNFLSYLSNNTLKVVKNVEKLLPESNAKETLELDTIPFINTKSCLTVLDFYQEVSITKLKYPVLIRKLLPAIIIITKLTDITKVWTQPIWYPKNRLILMENGTILKCRTSSLFFGIIPLTIVTDYCLFLDFFKFVSKSKPWTCQVHISLFQSLSILEVKVGTIQLTYPRLFEYLNDYTGFKYWVPSIIPEIHISVHNKVLKDSEKLLLYEWSQNGAVTYANRELWVNNALWFYICIQSRALSKSLRLANYVYKINIIHFGVCPTCKQRLISFNLNEGDISKIMSGNRNILNTLTFSENYLWEIRGSKNEMASVKFYQILQQCSIPPFSNVGPMFTTLNTLTPADKIELAYALLWRSIWKNYTYVTGTKSVCLNGILNSVSIQYAKSLQPGLQIRYKKISGLAHSQFPLTFEDNIGSLKFVSCGSVRNSNLLFDMLHKVYDLYIWLGIFISMAALLAIIFLKYGLKLSFLKSVQAMIGIAIEQGSPILDKITRFSTLRICLSAFYLAFIVISNAYKSQNVYHIVTPRQQIPYKTFQELINDNFIIYSRGFRPKFTPSLYRDKNTSFQVINKLDTDHSLRLMIPSFGRATVYSDAYGLQLVHYRKINLPPAEAKIMSNTSLHPDVIQITKNLGQLLYKHFRDSKAKQINVTFYGNKFRKLFIEQERDVLFKHLTLCKKAALILPIFEGIALARKLIGKRLGISVNVGKETYFKMYHAFLLKGNISPGIMQRIQSVRQSGLFEWWSRLLSRNTILRKQRRENELDTPSMDGNIFVIFVVLFVGLLGAITVLLLEMVCRCFKNVVICVHRNYFNCQRITPQFTFYP